MGSVGLRAWIASAAAGLALQPVVALPDFADVERIVAVADVHGAHDAFVDVLGQAGVIDEAGHWAGGATHLVIVGDVLDRGPDSRHSLDLIMQLETEAPAAGGRVHMLLGNHEVMNLTGDLRYVSDSEFASYAEDGSAADPDGQPRGFAAHRAAFAPDGRYGSWLLDKPFVAVINDTAFVHGGLSTAAAGRSADELNAELGAELHAYVESLDALIDAGVLDISDALYEHPVLLDEFQRRVAAGEVQWPAGSEAAARRLLGAYDELLFVGDGPTWYRGNVGCSAVVETDRLASALAGLGAGRIVVGHTPSTNGHIRTRLDERVYRIDTGMLTSYYGGRASALVIADGRIEAVYAGGDSEVPAPQHRAVGSRPGGIDDDALESFLAEASIVASQPMGRLTVLRLERDGLEVNAVFTPAQRRGFLPELAAYRLDRLLGFDMVPATAQRTIAGVDGSVQLLPANAIDETLRRQEGLGAEAWCPLAAQFDAVYLFDSLIFNSARTAASILFDLSSFNVMLSGHSAAFTLDRGRPLHTDGMDLAIPPYLRERLAAMSEENLTAELSGTLDRRRIDALLERRDALLETD